MEENLFRLYRKRAGYSQKEVAAALSVTTAAVSAWEVGRYIPDPQNLKALADLYGISIDMLLGRKMQIDLAPRQIAEQPELQPEEEAMIPLVASLRCGPGGTGEPFAVIKPIPVPSSYLKRWGDDLKAIIAVGESMSPTIIPGDMLICRPGDAWENGNVVSVNLDDMDMIKRIYAVKDGGIDLRSDNPAFEPIHIAEDDIKTGRFHVLGRVLISIGKEL